MGRVHSEVLSFPGPSPVPALIGTNHIPSGSEAHAIRDAISSVQPSLSALDDNITQLQAELAKLQQKRQILHSYSQEHRSLISPIRRFPAEVLGEVFSYCLPEAWQTSNFSAITAPMLCTHICSHWRAVAISTTKLWSSFSYKDEGRSYVALTTLWLARAGNCAMNVKIPSAYVDSRRGPRSILQVLDLLIRHSARWQHVEIYIRPSMVTVISALKNCLPRLKTLLIESRGVFDQQPVDAFESAPKLRNLHLCVRQQLSFVMPWAQLDECTVDSKDPCFALGILVRTTNLTALRLSSTTFLSSFLPPNIVRHTQLRSLSLCIQHPFGPNILFDYLMLPALQDIYISQVGPLSPWIYQAHLISFLSRSSCSLQKIVLHRLALEPIDLLHCIELSPALVELELRDIASHSLTRDVLSRLTYRGADGSLGACLAPALQIIAIDVYDTLNESLFLDMVESRRHVRADVPISVSPLTRVAISLPYVIGQLDRVLFSPPRVRKLRDEGLDISIVRHVGSSIILE